MKTKQLVAMMSTIAISTFYAQAVCAGVIGSYRTVTRYATAPISSVTPTESTTRADNDDLLIAKEVDVEPEYDPTDEDVIVSEYDSPIAKVNVQTCGTYETQNLPEGERYDISSDGETFVDRLSCYMWQRDPDTTVRTLSQAIEHCNNLIVGTKDDWRVPTWPELFTIVKPMMGENEAEIPPWYLTGCYSNGQGGFPADQCWAWTSTSADSWQPNSSYTIELNNGGTHYQENDDPYFGYDEPMLGICVRGEGYTGVYITQ